MSIQDVTARMDKWKALQDWERNKGRQALNAPEDKAFTNFIAMWTNDKALTVRQVNWFAKLLDRALAGAANEAPAIAPQYLFTAILELLNRSPGKVRFTGGYMFKYTGTAYTSYPHQYHVSEGMRYMGRLTETGVFLPARECGQEDIRALSMINANPLEAAVAYAQATGACSFCGRELTDDRSVAHGYGPICAEKYALPWGEAGEMTAIASTFANTDPEDI